MALEISTAKHVVMKRNARESVLKEICSHLKDSYLDDLDSTRAEISMMD